jgi:hypothetical protein
MAIEHTASGTRTLRHLAVLATALAARAALADEPADAASAPPADDRPVLLASSALNIPSAPPAQPAVARQGAPLGRRRHVLGLQLDAGVPDITAASVIYRPWSYVRFTGGMLYNLAGYGVRGGVSVQPYFPIAPSLTLEAGHYFDANVYDKLKGYATIDENLRPLLEKVGYTFVNAQVGLELGHPDWFVFFVRAGISRVWVSVHNANEAVKSATASANGTVLKSMDDPNVTLGIPNVKLGFMLFFF